MDVLYASGVLQVQQDGVEIMQIKLHADAVLLGSSVLRRDVVIAESGVGVVMNLHISCPSFPALPVEVEYSRVRLVEKVAGENHAVQSHSLAKRVDGKHVMILVGFGRHVEM